MVYVGVGKRRPPGESVYGSIRIRSVGDFPWLAISSVTNRWGGAEGAVVTKILYDKQT